MSLDFCGRQVVGSRKFVIAYNSPGCTMNSRTLKVRSILHAHAVAVPAFTVVHC